MVHGCIDPDRNSLSLVLYVPSLAQQHHDVVLPERIIVDATSTT
jgi:hypothetical protein